jgi:DNA-binding XRE family transcriptional regulator
MVTRLKLERIKRDLDQWQLAALVGITQTALSHYETGKRQCPVYLRQKISDVLRIPVKILFSNMEGGEEHGSHKG